MKDSSPSQKNKGCDIDLSYKQLLQNNPRLPFIFLFDEIEVKKSRVLNTQFYLSPLQKVKINRCFKKKLPNSNRKRDCW